MTDERPSAPPLPQPPVGAEQPTAAPTVAAAQPPRRPRQFRFSLRTLLVVMLLSALVCGWAARLPLQLAREAAAIERLKAKCDSVGFFTGAGMSGSQSATSFLSLLRRSGFLGFDRTQLVCEIYLHDATAAAFAELKSFPELRSLFVHRGSPLAGDVLAAIGSLKQLTQLELIDTDISEAGLEHLSGLTQLAHLTIYGMMPTDAGLKFVRNFKQLRSLKIYTDGEFETLPPPIGDEGIAHFRQLKYLEELNFKLAGLTDRGMADLANLTGLQMLSISNSQVTDAGVAHLAELPWLWHLELECPRLTTAGVERLHDCQALACLTIKNTQATGDCLAALAGLPNLTDLNWLNNARTQPGLRGIVELAHLTRVWLTGPQIDDQDLAHVSQLPELDLLDLTQTSATRAGLAALARSESLTYLELHNNDQIDDAAIAELRSCPSLVHLELAGDRLTTACLRPLTEWSRLQKLTIDCSLLGGEGLAPLEGFMSLPILALENRNENQISKSDVEQLRQALPNCEVRAQIIDVASFFGEDQPPSTATDNTPPVAEPPTAVPQAENGNDE